MDVKDFVAFETARKLKEAGFVQEWDDGGHKFLYVAHDKICRISDIGCYNYVDEPKDTWDIPTENYPCVTLWQAQKWLREVKGIDINISVYREIDGTVSPQIIKRSYECEITTYDDEDYIPYSEDETYFPSYEAALSAGIDVALNLITNKTEQL